MASYVDVNGVRTWYDAHGEGEPLVLLHPGLSDSRGFGPNLDALAARFRTYTPERRGHGHTRDVGPISFELMADDTIHFIERVVGGPARVLGCSDGAIVALLVALRRPDLVSRLVFVAGVFHHDGWLPGVIDSSAAPPDFMAASYGEVSPDGADHFPVVVEKLAQMHLTEPALTTSDLSRITSRTLVMMGDDDEVKLEHALALYRGLPTPNWQSSRARRTGCWWRGPGFATRSSSTFSATNRYRHWRPSDALGVESKQHERRIDRSRREPCVPTNLSAPVNLSTYSSCWFLVSLRKSQQFQ